MRFAPLAEIAHPHPLQTRTSISVYSHGTHSPVSGSCVSRYSFAPRAIRAAVARTSDWLPNRDFLIALAGSSPTYRPSLRMGSGCSIFKLQRQDILEIFPC